MKEWEYLNDLYAITEIQNRMLLNSVVEQADSIRIFGNVTRILFVCCIYLFTVLIWQEILMANIELYKTFQSKVWTSERFHFFIYFLYYFYFYIHHIIKRILIQLLVLRQLI